jgi:hypothetical protein
MAVMNKKRCAKGSFLESVLPPYASHIPNPSGGMSYWYDDQMASEGKDLWIEGAAQGADQIA